MTATSRWVRFPIAGATYVSSANIGQRGLVVGTGSTSDTFTIGASNNQIRVNLDGIGAQEITLTSGTDLDPRFVAKDIQRKLQVLSSLGNAYKYADAEFSNLLSGDGESHYVIRSGTSGASSSVAITDGTNNARSTLGLNTTTTKAGDVYHTDYNRAATNSNTYAGTATSSGTYGGLLDEEYHVACTNAALMAITPGGGNVYAGTAYVTGDWNHSLGSTYTVTIDASGGKEVMNAGTGSVPTFTATDAGAAGDNVAVAQELLFSDEWYYLGTYGARIKFTDAQFGNGDTFTITCTPAAGGNGAVGAATVRFYSDRGDNSSGNLTTSTDYVSIGTKGITMKWTSSTLAVQDEWRIMCRAPHPEAYGVTSMSYGNVTVTTNSPVKVHQFEIISGARILSNVKFSLYSHGTFSHHDAGNADTLFHYGTVGPANRGDGSGPVADAGVEWAANILATDISVDKTGGSTGSPTNLWASKEDLAVVSDADSAETIGNIGLASDAIFTGIKLGSAETGSNSAICMRAYFDYS